MSDPNVAFTLRIRLYRREHDPRVITITAYDDRWSAGGTHGWIDVEVKHGRAVIFPRGKLYCAVSHAAGHTSDSMAARELVMSLVAMRPGDTEREYFADYTPEQLAWVTEHGEALGVEREARYCDANGNLRKAG